MAGGDQLAIYKHDRGVEHSKSTPLQFSATSNKLKATSLARITPLSE